MSKQKFTPGPWIAHEGFAEQDYVYSRDDKCTSNHIICKVFTRPKTEVRGCPDAHLIAAAPEMYEALTIVCEECPRHHELDSCEWACTIGQALRKARGESEVSK